MNNIFEEFFWIGSEEHFVDKPNIFSLKHIVIGRYGGNSSAGQYKNEDGCLVWVNVEEDWEFTILLDAHHSSQSAELVLEQMNKEKSHIKPILSLPNTQQTFKQLEKKVLNMFQSEEFLSACRDVTGETACLIVVRKDKYVWWFSVGDCFLYLFHKQLATLSQYQVNQRQFYEWIGKSNTFEQEVPCYSTGIKELRKGENRLFLTTDGLIECPNEPFSNPINIYHSFTNTKNHEDVIESMFKKIMNNDVRDSTTIVSWEVNISKEATMPSDF